MTPRALIFDLDGTLLDTLEDLANSTNTALRRLGYPIHAATAYRELVGEGIEVLATKALPEDARQPSTVRDLVTAIRSEYSQHMADSTHPYPGICELLAELSARGVPLAVLSNKPNDATQRIVARMFERVAFAVVRGAVPEMPKKPDPKPALAIAGELALAPGEIGFVGDTSIDMKTATSAGMLPIGALWGFRPQELEAAGAEVLIAHPLELLPLFDG